MGMYHCPYCGEMVMAGMDHIDYREAVTVHRIIRADMHLSGGAMVNTLYCTCGQQAPCDYAEQADSDNAAMEDGTAL